jgi:PAT family beta-lactamase induction signal transducer AmpG
MTTRRHSHPSVYMFLITPFGVVGGYLTVALAFLLAKNHVSVEAIAALAAAALVPNVWKFLWAPVVDTTLTSRAWYLIGSVLTSAGIWAMGVLPMTSASVPMLTIIVLVANFAATLVGMATDSLMARATPDEEKGRAGGWFQAGNLGGSGIGGGVGLMLAQHLGAPWMVGAILAVLCLLCAIPLAFMYEPPRVRPRGVIQSVKFVVADVWSLARARMGFVALFLCFLPIGSGAASNLWSAVASDWRASANSVALVTGVMGGVVMAVGSLAGGWLCDRMDRKAAYVVYGVLQAACAVGMAFFPHTERMYIVWTTVYAFVTGLTYAGFTAFVLEAMGLGAAATKYNLFASLSNFPIMYMTTLDGHAHTRWGASGMLYCEAAVGLLGMVLFLAFADAVRRWWPAHWPVTVSTALEPAGATAPID